MSVRVGLSPRTQRATVDRTSHFLTISSLVSLKVAWRRSPCTRTGSMLEAWWAACPTSPCPPTTTWRWWRTPPTARTSTPAPTRGESREHFHQDWFKVDLLIFFFIFLKLNSKQKNTRQSSVYQFGTDKVKQNGFGTWYKKKKKETPKHKHTGMDRKALWHHLWKTLWETFFLWVITIIFFLLFFLL